MSSVPPVRVGIQQRLRLYREGLEKFLEAEGDIEVVGLAETADELIHLCDQHKPDVVLLEIDANEWNPVRLAVRLRRGRARLRIIGLYSTAGGPSAADVRRAGVAAFLPRSAGLAAILRAVRGVPDVARGITAVAPPGTPSAHAALTGRETTVIGLIAAGYSSRDIASRLGISRKTVENHKQRIFAKLGVQNQGHAVSIAIRNGLIDFEQVMDLDALH